MTITRIIGIDPSLVACGWGVIDKSGNKITHIAHGVIRPPRKEPLASRLHFMGRRGPPVFWRRRHRA